MSVESFISEHYRPLFITLGIVLIGLCFYGGMLYGKGSGTNPVMLSCSDTVLSTLVMPLTALASGIPPDVAPDPAAPAGRYVGSKNGTKYYLPTCSGVKRIKPENYRWFQTAQEAELQGYTPATSC